MSDGHDFILNPKGSPPADGMPTAPAPTTETPLGSWLKQRFTRAYTFDPKVTKCISDVCQLERSLAAEREKIKELERGEYICKKCGIRKDSEGEYIRGDF